MSFEPLRAKVLVEYGNASAAERSLATGKLIVIGRKVEGAGVALDVIISSQAKLDSLKGIFPDATIEAIKTVKATNKTAPAAAVAAEAPNATVETKVLNSGAIDGVWPFPGKYFLEESPKPKPVTTKEVDTGIDGVYPTPPGYFG